MNKQQKREVWRKYYWEHREQINEMRKKRYQQNKDKIKKRRKEKYWEQKSPRVCVICGKSFIPTNKFRKICSEKCRKELKLKTARRLYHTRYKHNEGYKKRDREYYQKRRQKLKSEIVRLIGNKCFVCNHSEKKMFYHEVHGKRHSGNLTYIIEHYEDFICLCRRCHYMLHFCLGRIPNFSLQKFMVLYKKVSQHQIKPN